MKFEPYTNFDRAQIISLRELGVGNAAIGSALKKPRSAACISSVCRRWNLPPRGKSAGGVNMNIKINKALHDAIKREAGRIGVSNAQFMRMATIAYLSDLGHR